MLLVLALTLVLTVNLVNVEGAKSNDNGNGVNAGAQHSANPTAQKNASPAKKSPAPKNSPPPQHSPVPKNSPPPKQSPGLKNAQAFGPAAAAFGAGAGAGAKASGSDEPNIPESKPGKVTCGECQATGDDCEPTSYAPNCDFCGKITGIPDDPKKVPQLFFVILSAGGYKTAKDDMAKFKGQKVTIRKCVTQSMIFSAGQKASESGCTDYPYLMGMSSVSACLCDDDCL